MHLRLFGSPALLAARDDHATVLLGPGKPLALLVRLVVAGPSGIGREALVELLWSHTDPERARASLRQALRQVRRALDADLIESESGGTVRLSASLSDERSALLTAVEQRDVDAVLSLHRGPFMGDFRTTGAVGFERWVDAERRLLATVAASVVEQAAHAAMANGRHRVARSLCGALALITPEAESPHLLALECAIAADDAIAARHALEAFQQWLGEDGLEASATARPLLARADALVRRRTVRPTSAAAGDGPGAEPASRGSVATTLADLAIDTIGREPEFAALLAAWERARTGLMIVDVEGEAGIGKTRLLRDLQGRWRSMGVPIIAITALQGMRGTHGAFLADVVHLLAQAPGALGIAEHSAATLVDFLPALRTQFRGVPGRDVRQGDNDNDDLAWRRAFAIADLLLAVTDERALVLLLDDLHWSDRTSRTILDAALDRARSARLLVVRAGRPEVQVPHARHASSRSTSRELRLSLTPLSEAHVASLLASLGELPATAWAEALPEALLAATGGIPLRLFEALAFLGDEGILTLTDGRWTTADPSRIAVRLAERSGLDARLEALLPTERDIIQALALAAIPLPTSLLLAVIQALDAAPRLRPGDAGGSPQDDSQARLESLLARGWIATEHAAAPATGEAPPPPDAEALWRIQHDLVGDQALAELREGDRITRVLATVLLDAGRARSARDGARYLHRAAVLASRLDDATLVIASFEEWAVRSSALVDRLDHSARIALFAGDDATGIAAVLQRQAQKDRQLLLRRRMRLGALGVMTVAAATGWARAVTPRPVANVPTSLAFVTRPILAHEGLPLQPIPAVEVRDAAGRRVDSASGPMTIALRGALDGLVGDARVTTEGGRAAFGAAIVTEAGAARGVRRVRVTYPGLPALETALAPRHPRWSATVRLRRFRLRADTVTLTGTDTLTVERGALVRGEVDVTLSAFWGGTAVVLLGAIPSWGPRETFHQTLGTVTSPVVDTTVTYSLGDLGLRMPSEPGLYHVVFVMGAEESVRHIASGTNWTMGAHRWYDGNDVRDWKSWQLASAQRYGTTSTHILRRYNASRYDLSPIGPRDSVVVEQDMQAATVLWVRVR